jgi:DNA-binding NarL/FixJ family response regulator
VLGRDAAVRYVPGSAEPGRPSEPADARRSRGRGRPPRVLVLDGGTVAAALTTRELNGAELQVITERVASENTFASAVRAFAPDVILVDQVLRQFDAVAALGLLRTLQSAVPLIVVAGALDTASVVAAFRAGAEDVILDSDLSRLGTAVAAAVAVRQPLQGLSPRQREVLRLMADGRSTREIAQLLRISVKTVETHRGELMRRLGIRGVPGLTRYALRVGLVTSDPEHARTTGPRWATLARASRS